jgi:hypothetical protein
MRQKGFSTMVVNKTIQGRIVDSFFRMQKGETTTITGEKVPNSKIMFMWLATRNDGKIEPDYVEANWKKLKQMILEHFSEDYARRNVFRAKLRWYSQHQNRTGVSKTYFRQLDKYPPADLALNFGLINEYAWQTFLYVNDKKILKKALLWMDRIIQHGATDDIILDTYANLLYKLGYMKEAMLWEEKAVRIRTEKLGDNRRNIENEFKPVLEKMKNGEPTYLEKGAIW